MNTRSASPTIVTPGSGVGFEDWMARAYALAMGAGTHAPLLLPPTIAFGELTGLMRNLAMTAAWLLKLLVVEWILARPVRVPAEKSAVRTCSQS